MKSLMLFAPNSAKKNINNQKLRRRQCQAGCLKHYCDLTRLTYNGRTIFQSESEGPSSPQIQNPLIKVVHSNFNQSKGCHSHDGSPLLQVEVVSWIAIQQAPAWEASNHQSAILRLPLTWCWNDINIVLDWLLEIGNVLTTRVGRPGRFFNVKISGWKNDPN